MDIQAGQTWSVPPHGPEIHVQFASPEKAQYHINDHINWTREMPRAAFEAHLVRLGAVVRK